MIHTSIRIFPVALSCYTASIDAIGVASSTGGDMSYPREVLAAFSERCANPSALMELTGGFSTGSAFLVWLRDGEAHVIKMGPSELIAHEHEHRVLREDIQAKLTHSGTAHLGDEAIVERTVAGRILTERWRAIAYPYYGGKSYRDLGDWGDFGDIARGYVSEDDLDRHINRRTLERAMDRVLDALFTPPAEPHPAPPLPLANYLPEPPWEAGIRAVIGTVLDLGPSSDELRTLESWWGTAVQKMSPAPYADRRNIHGDARFANIRVDTVSGDIHLIDFGNGQPGHIFQDLARFEVDLIFRSCPAEHPQRGEQVDSALAACISSALAPVESSSMAAGRILLAWRTLLSRRIPLYGEQSVRQMYLWFILVELVKRLRWLAPGDTSGTGASPTELVDAILEVRSEVAGVTDYTRVSESVGRFVNLVNCRRVYIPAAGRERLVNEKRNEAKKRFLRSIPEDDHVVIVAETGHSYLANRGPFNYELGRLLGTGNKIDIVIADMRGRPGEILSQAYERVSPEQTDTIPLHADLRRKFEESLEGFKALERVHSERINLHLSPIPPAMTFLLSRCGAFLEPYFMSNRTRRSERLFDSLELYLTPPSHLLDLLWESFANFVQISERHHGQTPARG